MGKSLLIAFLIALMVSGLAFVGSVNFGRAQSGTNSGDFWVSKTPMPTGYAWGAVTVNGEIYVIGSTFTYLYNPSTDTWVSKTPMPTSNEAFATATYQNKIYVFGGINGPTGISEVYNPATDTWEPITPMPTPRGELQANVVDGKIYLIGGGLGNGNTNTGSPEPIISNANEVYDPSSNSWATMAPIPTPVEYYASAVVDNKIYIISGQAVNPTTGQPFTVGTQIYDPETNTWSYGEPPPLGFVNAQAGATTGVWAPTRIYVILGNITQGTQVYDPQANSWTIGVPIPIDSGGVIAVVNDTLYVMQGSYTGVGISGVQFTTNAFNEQYFPLGYQGPMPLSSSSPSPSPASTSSPSPSPSQSPTTTSTSTASSTSPSASPSISQSQQPTASLPIELIVAAVVIVIILMAIGAFLLGKRTGQSNTH